MAGSLNARNFKQFFFDKKGVVDAVNKGKIRAMSRTGARVRTTAKQSIRYAPQGKSSRPGTPAFGHRSERFARTTTNKKTGVTKSRATSPLKELIFFGYDPAAEAVVIGPAVFRGAKTKAHRVPEALEKGGTVPVRRRGKTKRVTIEPRPTMQLALTKDAAKIPADFRGCVNNG